MPALASGSWAVGAWAAGAWNEGGSPGYVSVSSSAGTAAADDGKMGTIFLEDAEAVPATAVYINGIAHNNAGMRYVCAWPASDNVVYNDGIAIRMDGAMVITTGGTAVGSSGEMLTTFRGEVLATADAPDLVVGGSGIVNADGRVSMSEVA